MHFIRSTSKTKFHKEVEKQRDWTRARKTKKAGLTSINGPTDTSYAKNIHYKDTAMILHELSNIALKSLSKNC